MADVVINKFTTQILRDGATPSSPGFVVSEGQDPVNPPGTNNFVPYSGAISNVELGEYGLESGFITLDTTPTGTPVDQGTIYWDDSKSTAALIMNGTTQHIGQDTYFYVKNSSGSNIAKGVAVRFDGTDGASGHLLIAPFLADGTYPSAYFMGVTAEAINNGEFGQVTNFGEIEGIDTSIYSAGDLLYASTTSAGAFQTTAPVAPNNIVLIAAAINSKNNGAIIVRPTYGSNINDDEGVKIVSPTTGDLLQLQASGLWENKTKAQVLGGTSSQFVKGDGSLDSNTYGTGTVTSVGLSSATSGVTIGSTPVTSSGTITIAIATASGSQNGLLSSTDWTTFNNKQNALTNPVTGTGTTNYLPKFTSASTIGNSQIIDNGTQVGVGLTPNASYGTFQIKAPAGVYSLDLVGRTAGLNGESQITFWNAAQSSALAYLTNTASNLYIGTGANQPFTLSSGGNFIFGSTTDSGFKLDVSGTFRASSGEFINGGQDGSLGSVVRISTTNTNAGSRNWAIVNTWDNYGDLTFRVSNAQGGNALSAGATRMVLLANGNVGIGTSTNIYGKLSVEATGNHITMRAPGATAGKYWALDITTANQLYIINNAGTQYLTITDTGNVGIGTSSPGRLLSLNATIPVLQFINPTTGTTQDDGLLIYQNGLDSVIENQESGYLGFSTSATPRMRITSSGNVGIGTSSPAAKLEIYGGGNTLRLDSAANQSKTILLRNVGSGTGELKTDGDLRLNAEDAGKTIQFYTVDTERMRLTSGGFFKASTNGTYVSSGGYHELRTNQNARALLITNSSTTLSQENGLDIIFTAASPNNATSKFIVCEDTSAFRFIVYSNGNVANTNNSYGSISDIKLKENIIDASPKLNDLLKVKVRNYNLIGEESKQIGVIAQELEEVFPAMVDESIDKDKDGNDLGTTTKSVKYSVFVPMLIKAIQELKQEIDTLKNN